MLLIYCIKRINYKPSYDAVLLILPACWKEKERLHGTGVDWKHNGFKHYKYFKWAVLSLSFHRCNMIHFMEIKSHQTVKQLKNIPYINSSHDRSMWQKREEFRHVTHCNVCVHEQKKLDGFPGIILQTALRLGLLNTWTAYKDKEMFFYTL